MPSLNETYGKAATDLSPAELKKFLAWCNRQSDKAPAIVGGWAVYHYTPKLGSIDIDVVVRPGDAEKFRLYLKQNGFQPGPEEPNTFVRQVKPGDDRTETMRFDLIDYTSGNRIPWNLLDDHSTQVLIEGQNALIPCKELLLLQKVKAYHDRETTARMGHVRFPGGYRQWLERKIDKDKADIQNLLETGMDNNMLNQLLEKIGFKKIFEASLKEIGLRK